MSYNNISVRKLFECKGANASECIALFALGLYISAELFFQFSTLKSTYPIIVEANVLLICESIAASLAIISIAIKKQSFYTWQVLLAAAGLSVLLISSNRTNNYSLAFGYLFIIAVAGIDFRRLCKLFFYVMTPLAIIIFFLSITGLLYNRDIIPNSQLVFTYGFYHPNKTGCMLFCIISAMTFAFWKKRTWKLSFVVSIAAALFSYFFLSSHASAVLLAALSLINLIGHFLCVEKLGFLSKRWFLVILTVVPLCIMGIMLYCTAYYDDTKPLLSYLNQAIHWRPFFAHSYYMNHGGFTLFGSEMIAQGGYHTSAPFADVDCGYSYLALSTGLIPTCLLLVTYFVAIARADKPLDKALILVCFLLNAVYMMIEMMPLLLVFNYSILFLSSAFTVRDKGATRLHVIGATQSLAANLKR